MPGQPASLDFGPKIATPFFAGELKAGIGQEAIDQYLPAARKLAPNVHRGTLKSALERDVKLATSDEKKKLDPSKAFSEQVDGAIQDTDDSRTIMELRKLQPLTKEVDRFVEEEVKSAAVNLAVCDQALGEIGTASDQASIDAIVNKYGGTGGRLHQARAQAMTTSRDRAFQVSVKGEEIDGLVARWIDRDATARREKSWNAVEREKDKLNVKVDTEWERLLKSTEPADMRKLAELENKAAGHLDKLLEGVPQHLRTNDTVDQYKKQRLKDLKIKFGKIEFTDPARWLALKTSEGLIKSAESKLGVEIGADGKVIRRIAENNKEVETEKKARDLLLEQKLMDEGNILSSLMKSELGVEVTSKALKDKGLQASVKSGRRGAIERVGARMDSLQYQRELQEAAKKQADSKLGTRTKKYRVGIGTPVRTAKWLFGSVRGGDATTKVLDEGVIHAEAAGLAILAVKGMDKLTDMIHLKEMATQRALDLAPENLKTALGLAKTTAETFVGQVGAGNIPGGDASIGQQNSAWNMVHQAKDLINNAPRVIENLKKTGSIVNTLAPYAAVAAAAGRERASRIWQAAGRIGKKQS